MPAISRPIIGNRCKGIVTDGRTLRGMAKLGYFEWPVTVAGELHSNHPYVNEGSKSRSFSYKGQFYRVEYFDGCIFAFVVRQ